MDELITYMGYMWVQVDGDVVTVGINDDGLEEFSEILSADLPAESTKVDTDEVCGELETDQGPMNLYAPVDGKIVEVNEAVINSPSLIQEDPMGDGWLFKIEASDPDQVDSLSQANSGEDE